MAPRKGKIQLSPQKEFPEKRPQSAFCQESPTRAHHWVLEPPSARMKGKCKYCQGERVFAPFDEEYRKTAVSPFNQKI